MINREYGKLFIALGVIVAAIGGIMLGNAFSSLDDSGVEVSSWIIEGGAGLIVFGIFITFMGDKDTKCTTCGNRISSETYICPGCNTKTVNYYHQKVYCPRCGKRTHYDRFGGKCKYCLETLNLP